MSPQAPIKQSHTSHHTLSKQSHITQYTPSKQPHTSQPTPGQQSHMLQQKTTKQSHMSQQTPTKQSLNPVSSGTEEVTTLKTVIMYRPPCNKHEPEGKLGHV